MSGDAHFTGYTQSGQNLECFIDQEHRNCYVSVEDNHGGLLVFHFNPDFPDDATKCFESLCEVRRIEVDNYEEVT